MNEIKIERDIPTPRRGFRNTGKSYELWVAMGKMKRGDSFICENNTVPYRVAERHKFKITTRKIDGEGYRVWRVA